MSYRKMKALVVFLGFGLFLLFFFYRDCLGEEILKEKICGDYHIKIYEYVMEEGVPVSLDRLEIYKNNRLLFKDENKSFRIGLMYDEMPEDALCNNCQDITGDGKPNLVISTYSGGAHCCFGFLIFQLGDDFKLLDVINAGDSDLARFKDLDNDGVLEFIGNDWIFAYWNASFAGSPAPGIILKYINGKYRLAMDLMKKPMPNADEEERIIESVREDIARTIGEIKELKKDWGIGTPDVGADTGYFAWVRGDVVLPASVWGHMLDLIYAGHPTEAQKFIDEIWPKGQQGKKEFLSDFNGQLSLSPYYKDLRKYYGSDFAISYSPSLPNKR